MHKRYGEPDPTTADVVTQALEGIAEKEREDGQAPEPKRALFTKHVRAMVEAVQAPEPGADAGRVEWNRFHRGRRDAALLLVGFAGAMRRAELAAIEADDVSFNDAGMEIHLPKTKTEARTVGINRGRNPDFCPVRALREWLDVSGIESGPVFRAVPRTAEMKGDDEAEPMTGQSIRNVIGRAADAVDGLDRDDVAGHSLRRGHITQAAQNGASLERLMKQAGHVDPRTTTRYVEDANRMETNTSRDLGL
jgi:integrase